MVYRKGERPVVKVIRPYDARHPVAKRIAEGDHWLDAWLGQMSTPWEKIARKTGITRARIEELNDDAEPTGEELDKLAALWRTTPEGLRKAIDEAKSSG